MSTHAVSRLLAISLLAVAVAACGGDDQPSATEIPVTTTTVGDSDQPVDREVAIALADLAERLGVDESEIFVKSHEAVTWPDGSIGCPMPGMGYTQALVDGTQILLEVDSEVYAYHSAQGGEPTYCENPEPAVGQS